MIYINNSAEGELNKLKEKIKVLESAIPVYVK